jgi:signal transduction histidine kinase
MEALARSYVEYFTENAAENLERGGSVFDEGDRLFREMNRRRRSLIRSALFRRFPAYIVVLDSDDGAVLYSSGAGNRLENLISNSGGGIPVGIAGEMYDSEGELFTAAMFPSSGGNYMIAGAISWGDAPASAAISIYVWPVLMCTAVFWSAISVWSLWRRIIRPVSLLERDISSIRWGVDPLDDGALGAIEEIERIHATLVNVSRSVMATQSANRTFMNDMVNVQEDERTKISRDIHDGPLQDVTALIQRLHLARLPGNSEDDTMRELDLAEKIALTSVKEMRGLCDFLNPPWLELGLAQSLTELTERQSMQYGVRIFLGVDEDLNLSDSVTLAFFRVVQEAITNSVRHGEARNIWVDIKKNDDGLELTIQDDGHGFDMHESGTHGLRAEGHRGLSNMEERMTLVGGRLKIISFRGEGTCIRGFLP